MNPTVSVIMPNFNTAAYLAEAVESVLAQTPALELIVVDDGSTDGSRGVLETWQRRDRRVCWTTNRHQKGVSGARNTALELAQGEWVAFLDSDDVMKPRSLGVRLEAAARWPEVDFIFADHVMVDEARRAVGGQDGAGHSRWAASLKLADDGCPLLIRSLTAPLLQAGAVPWIGTVMARRRLLEQVGGFDETMSSTGEDIHLWLRLARVATAAFVPATVAEYRQRNGSAMRLIDDMGRAEINCYGDLIKRLEFRGYRRLLRRRIAKGYFDLSWRYREQRKFFDATRYAFGAIHWQPARLAHWKNWVSALLRHGV